MKHDGMSMDQRRAHLAAEIAKQRGDFAKSYNNLATPLHYTETAMRGFGFIRQNPWVLSVVPAVFSIGSSLFGLRKGKGKSKPRSKMSLSERRELERDAEKESSSLFGHAVKWGGRGFTLFKTYRRLRHFFQ